jgi:hypothetical protein
MDFPVNLYYEHEPENIQVLDRCRGDDDFRKIYLTTNEQRKIVIKHTSNSFTDKMHIEGWFRLAEAYRNIGIYCPSPVSNLKGENIYSYVENGKTYYVYAEEFAEFPTAESIGEDKFKATEERPIFLRQMMKSLGSVAEAKLDVVSFHSGYCLLEPYAPPDTTDETTECALLFVEYVRNNLPSFKKDADEIWERFSQIKDTLQEKYNMLPTSCFQADLNLSNILLDEKYDFAGLIDFNLSGKEPSLNYLIREALWWADDDAMYDNGNALWYYDEKIDARRMEYFCKNMEYIGEEYRFSPNERGLFPVLFQYINSIWWGDIRELKRIKDTPDQISCFLKYIKKQLMRTDISLP